MEFLESILNFNLAVHFYSRLLTTILYTRAFDNVQINGH